MLRLRLPGLAACVASVAACSSQATGTLQIVTGAETDTFTRDPAAVTLEVDSVDSSGTRSTLATSTLPASTIDLGTLDQTTVGTFDVTATDAAGDRVVYGQSVPFELGVLQGVTAPIFVQRTGELARMPGPLSDGRSAPVLGLFAGRYLFVGGGTATATATTSQLYDFGAFAPLSSPPTLPMAPESVAFLGTVALLIDDAGATSYDFSQSTAVAATALPGATFADVSGGATVVADDGSQFVVGATRTTGTPTSAVLAFDASGNASWVTLSAPRLGAAAATWVQGRGLVVIGGSASAPGVEIVSTGGTSGAPLGYPPDDATGAGAAALDAQHVLLAGGLTGAGVDPGVRSIDLTCTQQCSPAPWPALPASLSSAQVFASDASDALVVGDDATATTHVYVLSAAAPTVELDTRVPLSGARAVVSPLGSVVLFGGASVIESFIPGP